MIIIIPIDYLIDYNEIFRENRNKHFDSSPPFTHLHTITTFN